MTDPAATFATLRDWFRYAVSRFNAADLVYGHGTDNPFDEAAFLLLEGLRLPVDRLEPFLDARLLPAEAARLSALIDARVAQRVPAPYLVGAAYIQGVRFRADPRALIPRSFIGELLFTETLRQGVVDADAVTSVLDLCTGSGCLAILAALAFPAAQVDAADLSPEALDLALENVRDHGLTERVALHRGDLFQAVAGRRYDLILANPPYVDAVGVAALPPEYRQEPMLALAAGADGLDIVLRLLDQAGDHLGSDGVLVCEVGRAAAALVEARPDLPFNWLDTEGSSGEVFWLPRAALV